MRLDRRVAGFLGFVFLLMGGCPTGDTLELITGSDSFGSDSAQSGASAPTLGSASPAVTTASAAAVEASFENFLQQNFPSCEEPGTAAQWREQVLLLVNRERAARGIDPVRQSDELERQAAQYACEMIEYEFFSHVNPVTGSSLAQRAADFNYSYTVIGENLAAGQPDPISVVDAWMNSSSHRDNILDPRFTELGVAVRIGGPYGIYWVQEFGRPFSSP